AVLGVPPARLQPTVSSAMGRRVARERLASEGAGRDRRRPQRCPACLRAAQPDGVRAEDRACRRAAPALVEPARPGRRSPRPTSAAPTRAPETAPATAPPPPPPT